VKVQDIEPELVDLFVEVGQLCREVDMLLREKSKVTSPVLKVQLFERGIAELEKLKMLQQKLRARREQVEVELKRLNVAWESAPPVGTAGRREALPLGRLEQVYRVVSYLSRW